jgi:hypothetical protein
VLKRRVMVRPAWALPPALLAPLTVSVMRYLPGPV